ncbi:unnamed protein product [marine sediment metagenome]|uniref:Uncharacterized protein n=1 Tax=marine sediment metagenome TaxID=412755 RepID=X1TJW2_9ZZZZ
MTGLHKNNVCATIRELETGNVIWSIDKIKRVYSYKINPDHKTWKI